MAFVTFTRTWWRNNSSWPNGLEPYVGTRRHKRRFNTEEEAKAECKAWNDSHDPGQLSCKMEYEGV